MNRREVWLVAFVITLGAAYVLAFNVALLLWPATQILPDTR